jgi:hypothetical protein
MKIRVSLKDPDTMHDAVCDAVQRDTKFSLTGVTEPERVQISRDRSTEIQGKITDRWMPYGEYLLVEFDTDDWSAKVLPSSEHR